MAFAVAGCSFDGVFLVGTLDGAFSYSSSQDQPAVTTIATKQLKRLRKCALLRTIVGREMDGGDFERLL